MFVQEGTTNGDTGWLCTNDSGSDVVGTDALTFSRFTDTPPSEIDGKQSVRVATTTGGTLASDFENGDSVDGVTLATGDRILIKNQGTATENGIYTVNASGAPTRATDFATGDSVASAYMFVQEGTMNGDTGWLCTNNSGSDVVGTDNLGFMKFTDTTGSTTELKQSVRVATVVSGTLASDFENGDTIDGVVIATGDRILIKNQASGVENGIYLVNASGAPTRSTDFDTGNSVASTFMFVQEGSTNADSGWLCTNNSGSDTVGTDALGFIQFTNTATINIRFQGICKSCYCYCWNLSF